MIPNGKTPKQNAKREIEMDKGNKEEKIDVKHSKREEDDHSLISAVFLPLKVWTCAPFQG